MHTTHSLPYRGSLCPGGLCPGGSLSRGVSVKDTPLCIEWLTDRCKNITFLQLRLQAVKNLIDNFVISSKLTDFPRVLTVWCHNWLKTVFVYIDEENVTESYC